jgi:hypothetical protein
MNQKVHKVLLRFHRFYESALDEFADFKLVNKPERTLKALIDDEQKNTRFHVIGQDGTGSVIALWRSNRLSNPIVWLSSEGFPNSVFANSIQEFLSILPFGTAFIYDVLCNHYFHKESPKLQPAPKQKFTPAKMKLYLKHNEKRYKAHAQFMAWLRKDMKIAVAGNPLAVIEKAIRKNTDLSGWLKI